MKCYAFLFLVLAAGCSPTPESLKLEIKTLTGKKESLAAEVQTLTAARNELAENKVGLEQETARLKQLVIDHTLELEDNAEYVVNYELTHSESFYSFRLKGWTYYDFKSTFYMVTTKTAYDSAAVGQVITTSKGKLLITGKYIKPKK